MTGFEAPSKASSITESSITTGRLTNAATEASYKEGAISILLLDGGAPAELVIDRGIGVARRPLNLYEVDDEGSDCVTTERATAARTAEGQVSTQQA